MNIELINITKTFTNRSDNNVVFSDLNLFFHTGEFVSILGPNGCGKSTLFNILIGLDKEYAGQVKINNLLENRKAISYMMQKDLLLPWKNVYQNIIIGLEIQKKVNENTKKDVQEYLERFSISDTIYSYPTKLSGGTRQKIALIRTLMLDADIVLLDEPFSAIDYNTRLELQAQLCVLAKEKNKTFLLITHDIDEAISVSDRTIIFTERPSRIYKDFKINIDYQKRITSTVRQDENFPAYFEEIRDSLPNRAKK